MGAHIVTSYAMDVTDTSTDMVFLVGNYDRISVQMRDSGGVIGTGVFTLDAGIDGVAFSTLSGASTFTSTGSTHFQTALDVEAVSHCRIRLTTANSTAGSVHFTVYGYNVED